MTGKLPESINSGINLFMAKKNLPTPLKSYLVNDVVSLRAATAPNTIWKTTTNVDEEHNYMSVTMTQYNDKNQPIREIHDANADGLGDCDTVITYKYDEQGRLSEKFEEDHQGGITPDGIPEIHENYVEYHENGTPSKSETRYVESWNPWIKPISCTDEFNENGEITKSVGYNEDGSVRFVWEYSYDENGKSTRKEFNNY